MKSERQKKILELITKKDIGTQEELTFELINAGFDATQATVSRDIREMKLTKVAMSDGRPRYVAYHGTEENLDEKYARIFNEGFLSMDNAQNILVIKTVSGMASAVGAALDYMNYPEIVGCIAGDDTLMCAIRTVDDALRIMDRLEKLLDRDGRV